MEISHHVIGLAIEVHRQLGPGLLESAYQQCLCQELRDAGLPFAQQMALPIIYKGRRLDFEYRMDIVVEPGLVLEIKSVASLLPLHEAQLVTYLRLSGHRRLADELQLPGLEGRHPSLHSLARSLHGVSHKSV